MAVYSCVSTLVFSSNPQVKVLSLFCCFLNDNIVLPNSVCPFLNVTQILSLVPELVNLFAQVVVSPVETPEVKAVVGRAFSHLISLYGQQMQPLLSNLPPAHANALSAFAQRS